MTCCAHDDDSPQNRSDPLQQADLSDAEDADADNQPSSPQAFEVPMHAVAYLGFHKEGGSNSPLLPSLPLSSPPSPPTHLPSQASPSPSLPLEVDPLNPARGSGEHCKLPQRGMGRSPSRKRILEHFLAKNASGHWWQRFYL